MASSVPRNDIELFKDSRIFCIIHVSMHTSCDRNAMLTIVATSSISHISGRNVCKDDSQRKDSRVFYDILLVDSSPSRPLIESHIKSHRIASRA